MEFSFRYYNTWCQQCRHSDSESIIPDRGEALHQLPAFQNPITHCPHWLWNGPTSPLSQPFDMWEAIGADRL